MPVVELVDDILHGFHLRGCRRNMPFVCGRLILVANHGHGCLVQSIDHHRTLDSDVILFFVLHWFVER